MKFQCAVCGSENVVSKTMPSREGFDIELIECDNCGHLSQNTNDYEDIYTTGEFSKIARNDSYTPDKHKISQLDKKAFERYEFYKDFFKKNDNFLEVGSSIGSFVYLLKMRGKKIEGLEPDPNYAGFSEKQYGFIQHSSLLENFEFTHKFDSAFSFHVIEHVKNPVDFLEKLTLMLNVGAEVLFECPSLEIHQFGDMKNTIWKPHLHYFSAPSLYFLFSKYFKVNSIDYSGSAIFIKATYLAKNSFHESIFLEYKKKAEKIFKICAKFPVLTTKYPIKQLAIQGFIQKGKFLSQYNKAVKYAAYKIDEFNFLRKEKGTKGIKAYHVTNFKGWGNNAGDIVLSKCVRDVLRQKGKIKFEIKAISEKVNNHVIDKINQQNCLIIGGGGLLLPDTNPNTISGWQWAVSEELLNKINVPIIVYAIGYNYFRGQKPDAFFLKNLNLLLERADFFSLRNYGSIQAVNELTENKFSGKIIYQPCPTTVIRKFDKSIPVKQKTKNIAVNVAFDRPLLRFGKNYEQILTGIAKAVKELEIKGYRIYNYTHITADRKFEILLDRLNVNYRTVELQYLLPNEIYSLYNNMELVIGMRGHAQMIPFGLNTKILTLGTHDKMRWFMHDIDALDYYVELHSEEENIQKIIFQKAVDILEKNSNFVEQKLLAKQDDLFKITQINLDKIYSIIK